MNRYTRHNPRNIEIEEEEKIQKINNSFSHIMNDENKIKNFENKNINVRMGKSAEKGKNLGTFILGPKLGEGTFGVVRIATHILTGEKVAVKILEKQKLTKDLDKKRLEREIKILKMMHHNNIVQLYNVIETSQSIYLVMEFIDGKELYEYIISKRRLSELEACKFYQQLISSIEYLGKMKIAHRDLKPENLLLDKNKNIKLVDFGLSNMYKNNELLSTPCGSPSYAPPEMVCGEKYNGLIADIWSSGIILFAMICGYLPFEDRTSNQNLFKKIQKGIFTIPEHVSNNAKDILHRILNVEPDKRYNIEQIKAHPWFNIINPKIYMSEGLLINTHIVPIDEEIIEKMSNEYEFNSIEVRVNLLANKHNHMTTTYYLLLKKKIYTTGKSIGNLNSKEFRNFINNKENLISNYNGNWKLLFKERAGDKYLKEESKENKNSKEKIENKENIAKFVIIENINNNIEDKEKVGFNDKKESNEIQNNKQINEEQNEKKLNDNNIKIIKNIENTSSKNKIENIEQIKKPTIFYYLKKIKEIQRKNKYDKNKKSNNCIRIKEQTPTNKSIIPPKDESIFQSEKLNKTKKTLKEYENEIINNKKSTNKNYAKSSLIQNSIGKDNRNIENKNELNSYFDIKETAIEKKDDSINDDNILSEINNLYLETKEFNNLENNNDLTNNINLLTTDLESPNQNQVNFASKNKQKRFVRHKYVESRYLNSKNSNNLKVEEINCNSFKNINYYNEIQSKTTRNKKRKNIFKDNYKTINAHYSHIKSRESSLNKRKKYSESVDLKRHKTKKNKNNIKNSLIYDDNFFLNTTMENNENFDSSNIINTNDKNSNLKKKRNININLYKNKLLGINYNNYNIPKRRIRNQLFNESKNKGNKTFFNVNVNLERIDIDTDDGTSPKKKELKKSLIQNYKNNQNIRTNSEQKQKKNKSFFQRKKRPVKELYLKINTNNNNFNSKRINNNKSKNINLNHITKNNSISKTRNKKSKIQINKNRSTDINEDKNKKPNLFKRIKANYKIGNSKIINGSKKKLIINDYISNTHTKPNKRKKRRIIKSHFNLNDETLIKSFVAIDLNNFHFTTNINEAKDANSNINYTNYYSIKKKSKKMMNPKKDVYLPLDLNNIFIVDISVLKRVINKELESKKIKYYNKNNKYLCWKNDNKLFFELKEIDEINNCYIIIIEPPKQKNNFFNISFWKEFLSNIYKIISSNI